jgi:tetratricopeptide (TPR) repeat protein
MEGQRAGEPRPSCLSIAANKSTKKVLGTRDQEQVHPNFPKYETYETSGSFEHTKISRLLKDNKNCGSCSKAGCELRCSCNRVFYCGAECQGKHWPTHKKVCTVALAKKIRKARREHGKDGAEVAVAQFEAGCALQLQGRYKDAERCYLDGRRIIVEVQEEDDLAVGDASPLLGRELDGEGSVLVGDISRALGTMYLEMSRYEEALAELSRSLRIFRSTEGERSQKAVDALREIGEALLGQGKHEEALARVEEAQSILKEAFGPEHSSLAGVLRSKGNCYFSMDRPEANAAYEEALRIGRASYGDDSDEVAASLASLAHLFAQKCTSELFGKARTYAEEALRIYLRKHGKRHPSVANQFFTIARILKRQCQLDEALKVHKKALKIRRRVLGEDHQDVALSLEGMGAVFHWLLQWDDALEMYEKALAVYTRAFGSDSRSHVDVLYNMAVMKKGSGDTAGAIESAREAERICAKLGRSSVWDQGRQRVADYLDILERVHFEKTVGQQPRRFIKARRRLGKDDTSKLEEAHGNAKQTQPGQPSSSSSSSSSSSTTTTTGTGLRSPSQT